MLALDQSSVSYHVLGPLFFGSSNDLVDRFLFADDPLSVSIDFSRSHIWDASSVAVLDAITTKYRDRGASVIFSGLDQLSSDFHSRLSNCV